MVGDERAAKWNGGQKTQTERAGPPLFRCADKLARACVLLSLLHSWSCGCKLVSPFTFATAQDACRDAGRRQVGQEFVAGLETQDRHAQCPVPRSALNT